MSYTHGGDIYGTDTVKIDFSVNTNCLGMPKEIQDAVITSKDAWEKYPDSLCRELRLSAADFYNFDGTPFPEEWLVFGNGASDILYTVIAAIRPQEAVLLAPGFSEYEQALRTCGCKIQWIYLDEKKDFLAENISEELYLKLGASDRNKILILGNPNNPTGRSISVNVMEEIVRICKKTRTWLIIDECFQWFLDNRRNASFVSKITSESSHVIILNALTKICSMAGLRLGFGIIPDEKLRDRLCQFRQPWSVSVPAQSGGVTAFLKLTDRSDGNYLQRTLDFLKIERQWLSEKLSELGFKVYPTETNYILFRTHEDDNRDYKELCLKQGILIRACDNFEGLDSHYYRVAVKNRPENEILINTFRYIQHAT